MPRLATLALLAAACAPAFAQEGGADAEPGRRNQRIERLVHEDSGSRIEELRVGGQTQAIVVQPKAPVPEYEVAPTTPSRATVTDERNGARGAGQRFWNVFRF